MKPLDYRILSSRERREVREMYIEEQKGNCHHCGTPLSGEPSGAIMALPVKKSLFPPNFFKNPIHLHHSHKTGMTIGAVHCQCNAVLWQYHGE